MTYLYFFRFSVVCQERKNLGWGSRGFSASWRVSKGLALGRRSKKGLGGEAWDPVFLDTPRDFKGYPFDEVGKIQNCPTELGQILTLSQSKCTNLFRTCKGKGKCLPVGFSLKRRSRAGSSGRDSVLGMPRLEIRGIERTVSMK